MKPILIKLLSLFSQFGIDPLRLIKAIQGIPAYLRDLRTFRRHYQGPLQLMPCLHDRYEEGGITRSEYFWQDLLVARWIYEANPRKHVDVGSRGDGFVAHVASFRELEMLDLRPITTAIPGLSFRQADLMSPDSIAGLIVGGGTATRSPACMCWSISAWAPTPIRWVRRVSNAGWPIWRRCCNRGVRFTSPPRWDANGWSSATIGCLPPRPFWLWLPATACRCNASSSSTTTPAWLRLGWSRPLRSWSGWRKRRINGRSCSSSRKGSRYGGAWFAPQQVREGRP